MDLRGNLVLFEIPSLVFLSHTSQFVCQKKTKRIKLIINPSPQNNKQTIPCVPLTAQLEEGEEGGGQVSFLSFVIHHLQSLFITTSKSQSTR